MAKKAATGAVNKPLVGFIGQGYVGSNYADNFEARGYQVVRYALQPEYIGNKGKIKDCDIVFVAVPTPTTPKGFDGSIVEEALALVGKGKIAVVKSTIPPGTTKSLQEFYPDRIVLNSPEFLNEATAAKDVAEPFSNIVGMPLKGKKYERAAATVLAILPKAPMVIICQSHEAEVIKYAHNVSGYTQIIFFNLMYDLTKATGGDWSVVERAIKADPFIPNRYARPVDKGGRGAGGHCFIKDAEALFRFYKKRMADPAGLAFLENMIKKNIELLSASGKSLDILRDVYGDRAKTG
jgi:nucleotide sugar dehydrogenase